MRMTKLKPGAEAVGRSRVSAVSAYATSGTMLPDMDRGHPVQPCDCRSCARKRPACSNLVGNFSRHADNDERATYSIP